MGNNELSVYAGKHTTQNINDRNVRRILPDSSNRLCICKTLLIHNRYRLIIHKSFEGAYRCEINVYNGVIIFMSP